VASPIISLNLPLAKLSNSNAVDQLYAQFGVVVKLLPDYEGGNPFVVNAIRVSLHLFNDETDVARFIEGLTALLTAAPRAKAGTGT
jgi:selenocysteine lyase/cysteine desulfurase